MKSKTHFSEVTFLIADILSHDWIPFEKRLPKLREFPAIRKRHTLLSGVQCVHLCMQAHCQLSRSKNQMDWWKALTQNIPLKLKLNSVSQRMAYFCLAIFFMFFRIMFHLVSATSMALTIFLFSYCLGAKGKWRILSGQTQMLCKRLSTPPIEPTRSGAVKLSCWAMWRTSEGEGKCRRHYCLFMPKEEGRGEKNRVIEQSREEIVLWCKQRSAIIST